MVDKCIQKHTEKATERSRHADKGKHTYSMLWDLSNCGRPNCWPINVTPDSSHNLFHSFGPTECIPVPCSFDFTGKQCAVHIVHLMTRLIAHFFYAIVLVGYVSPIVKWMCNYLTLKNFARKIPSNFNKPTTIVFFVRNSVRIEERITDKLILPALSKSKWFTNLRF